MLTSLMNCVIYLLVLSYLVSTPLHGDNTAQVATVTRVEGQVQILTNPSNVVTGQPPHAKYKGKYYTVVQVEQGSKLDNGNIIQSSLKGRARLIYPNGDQITVGPGTSYEVNWKKGMGRVIMDLFYGKVRGVISKIGPRKNLEVKTKFTAMGIRGTDFFVSARGGTKGTQISVLRGKVAVKKRNSPAKPFPITSGFSASIKTPIKLKEVEEEASPTPIIVRKTSKVEFLKIQKNTVVKKKKPTTSKEKQLSKKMAKLEKKAVKTTLEDIKQEDPKLYKKLNEMKKPVENTDQLNTATVKKLFKKAPKTPPNYKMKEKEFEELDNEDVYEKYFKF